MNVHEAIRRRRSIRRFKQIEVPMDILEALVDSARLVPSAANLQPCEYIIVNDEHIRAQIFSTLRWAAYVAPKRTPKQNQQPTAYIVCIINKNKAKTSGNSDAALGCGWMILHAMEFGLGTCLLASIDRDEIRKILNVPDYCEIWAVLALGYPDEEPKITELKDSVEYYVDQNDILYVPKRSLKDILHYNAYQRR